MRVRTHPATASLHQSVPQDTHNCGTARYSDVCGARELKLCPKPTEHIGSSPPADTCAVISSKLGKLSLCMSSPYVVRGHRQRAPPVPVVVMLTDCTVHNPCYRFCLLYAVLILPSPQQLSFSRAPCGRVNGLLSRIHKGILCRGVRNIGRRRICE